MSRRSAAEEEEERPVKDDDYDDSGRRGREKTKNKKQKTWLQKPLNPTNPVGDGFRNARLRTRADVQVSFLSLARALVVFVPSSLALVHRHVATAVFRSSPPPPFFREEEEEEIKTAKKKKK
jgi:hypothetical protein